MPVHGTGEVNAQPEYRGPGSPAPPLEKPDAAAVEPAAVSVRARWKIAVGAVVVIGVLVFAARAMRPKDAVLGPRNPAEDIPTVTVVVLRSSNSRPTGCLGGRPWPHGDH